MGRLGESKYLGQTIGSWTVLRKDVGTRHKWFCRCKCGEVQSKDLRGIVAGLSTQCKQCWGLSQSEHLIGTRFEFLEVLNVERIEGVVKLLVKCDCGNICHIRPRLGLEIGKYKSCGKCRIAFSKSRYDLPLLTVNEKRGMYTILKVLDKNSAFVRCDCGNELKVTLFQIKGKNPNCGCVRKRKNIDNALKLIGHKHEMLKVIDFLGMKKNSDGCSRARYLLRCKCGVEFEQSISYLKGSKSCGCLQRENAARGENSAHAKLRDFEAKTIKDLFKSKLYSKNDLAQMFGVSLEIIRNLIKGKTWRHIQ